MKICSTCKEAKPLVDYYYYKNKPNSQCKLCKKASGKRYILSEKGQYNKRRASFKHNYGLCITEYNRLLEEQNGVCAVCFTSSKTRRTEHLFVDHDHRTGKVRGLLCRDCNIGLGNLRDSIFIIRSFEIYLLKYLQNIPRG